MNFYQWFALTPKGQELMEVVDQNKRKIRDTVRKGAPAIIGVMDELKEKFGTLSDFEKRFVGWCIGQVLRRYHLYPKRSGIALLIPSAIFSKGTSYA